MRRLADDAALSRAIWCAPRRRPWSCCPHGAKPAGPSALIPTRSRRRRAVASRALKGARRFQKLVRDALACAAQEGSRELHCEQCPTSTTGPWASAPWSSSLRAMGEAGKRSPDRFLAADYAEVQRRMRASCSGAVRWDHIIVSAALVRWMRGSASAIWSPSGLAAPRPLALQTA